MLEIMKTKHTAKSAINIIAIFVKFAIAIFEIFGKIRVREYSTATLIKKIKGSAKNILRESRFHPGTNSMIEA